MKIRFYQSASKPSGVILASLLEKTLERNNTALVRCGSQVSARNLSASLWERDGFLPHGLASEDSLELQPIWLSYAGYEGNNMEADILFLCDSLTPEIADAKSSDSQFSDIALLFDKADEPASQAMREFWKYLQQEKLPHVEEITFWKQENGKWTEAAKQKDNGDNKT